MITHETQLYQPIKSSLEAEGYKVAGEVKSCDLVATRGSDLLIVEMKRVFNLELIFQGIQRQKLSPVVYLAIEEPRRRSRSRWRKIMRLCRLLGLGLMTVSFSGRGKKVTGRMDVVLDPAAYKPRVDTHNRKLLLREFENRSADFNVGGSCRRPIMTAYREEALRIASQLLVLGPSKVRSLTVAAQSNRAGSILLNNYYGWFERVDRGIYALTPKGCKALEEYAHVVSVRPAS